MSVHRHIESLDRMEVRYLKPVGQAGSTCYPSRFECHGALRDRSGLVGRHEILQKRLLASPCGHVTRLVPRKFIVNLFTARLPFTFSWQVPRRTAGLSVYVGTNTAGSVMLRSRLRSLGSSRVQSLWVAFLAFSKDCRSISRKGKDFLRVGARRDCLRGSVVDHGAGPNL